jgi:hypothetical protein
MANQPVVEACQKHWEAHKSDCSGFVRAVAAEVGIQLTGDADAIVAAMQSSGWLPVGNGAEAKAKAETDYLVLAGLSGKDHSPARSHGHVVVVVPGPLADGKYPTAYWGSLGGGGKKTTTLNWSWTEADRDKVAYAAHVLPFDYRVKRLDEFLARHGIVGRAAWGARATTLTADPQNTDWDYTTVVLHHSGRFGQTDPKAIQRKHMDGNHWDDVGYHFMIGPAGQIYEGRRLIYKGSHTENANTGKVGVLVMGNFEKELFGLLGGTPTAAQLKQVKSLVLWLKELFPSLAILGGHKDFKKGTECPGNQLYPLLDEMRKATELRAP